MHDLVDNAFRQRIDGHLLLAGKVAEAAAEAIDFCLPNGLEVLLQRDDGRHNVESLQPG